MLRSISGSLAKFAAIRRASSLVSRFAAERIRRHNLRAKQQMRSRRRSKSLGRQIRTLPGGLALVASLILLV